MRTVAIALATSVLAIEPLASETSGHILEASTDHDEYRIEPAQVPLWKNYEFLIGSLLGLYLPINNYANNYDC